MFKPNRNILKEKLRESLISVLPIAALVFIICFLIVPVPNSALLAFILGAMLLVIGMGLFTLGTDMAMTPIGEYVGTALTRSRKVWLIALVGLVLGILITVAEPDLQVLAEQVPNVPNMVLIMAVAIGVGLFLVMALLRILLKVKMKYILAIFYIAVFILAQFVPKSFLAVAFDSGGDTVVHAKGTGTDFTKKFFGVSIASEKDIVLIVVKREDKANVMRTIMAEAGIRSEAHTALISLPVEHVVGLTSVMTDADKPD